MNSKRHGSGVGWLVAIVLVALLSSSLYWMFFSGYRKVSRRAYQCTTALYGACVARSIDRLEKVEQVVSTGGRVAVSAGQPPAGPGKHLVDGELLDQSPMSAKEQRWLNQIIQTARAGDWESAAASAKSILKDQVEY